MTPLILSLLAIQLNLASLQLEHMQPVAEAAVMTSQDYAQYAESVALKDGIDPGPFVATLNCESQFRPDAVGDHGTSFGIAQIHLVAHQDISKEQALDPIWSIDWSARQFAAGNAHIWTCFHQFN